VTLNERFIDEKATGEMERNAERTAAKIESVDRLVRSTSSSEAIGQTIYLGDTINGGSYSISVLDSQDGANAKEDGELLCPGAREEDVGCIVIRKGGTEPVTRTFVTGQTTEIETTENLSGGPLYIVREEDDGSVISIKEN
jgi:hypothetical protein